MAAPVVSNLSGPKEPQILFDPISTAPVPIRCQVAAIR